MNNDDQNKNSIVYKLWEAIKRDGWKKATNKAFSWIATKIWKTKTDVIYERRVLISSQISDLFNSTIRYGPFKGLQLSSLAWWGSADRGAMLLGLYEKEILESLQMIPDTYDTFIDLGAADGYYGLGVLINGQFKKSICYESSERGRKAIRQNAELNNLQNNIEIRGIATKYFYRDIPTNILSKSVLFIDIEGSEFDLLDAETFLAFKDAIIFIELHEWFYDDGEQKLDKLKDDSYLTHEVTELTMRSRDLSSFHELKKLSDTDRWLLCSEGRGQLMTWLRLDPK